MYIHRSNRSELLVDALAEVIDKPLASWTEPETIVVQGRGMERWLAMRLAERQGVYAHARFPFPRAFLDEAVRRVQSPGSTTEESVFVLDRLKWAVLTTLPDLLDRTEFNRLQRYVTGEAPRRQLHLADRIANCLDRYVVYRPELITRWEEGTEGDHPSDHATWQSVLWRELIRRYGHEHLVSRIGSMVEQLQRDPSLASSLPSRVCLFGVNSLPPLYVEAFQALGSLVEMHLFTLNPSPEWYGDLSSRQPVPSPPAIGSDSTVDDSHPLIGSLGRMSRDFLNLVAERVDDITQGDRFEAPEPSSLLAELQRDLFFLRRPGHRQVALDSSISIHACHGPMREVEVLRDQLLGCLDDLPTLEPEDICVLSPDIETYAPYVNAVFGADDRLPYRIADRTRRRSGVVTDGFFQVLETVQGRAGTSELLDLLHLDPVRARFGIAQKDLAEVERLLSEVQIRWGIDAEHRKTEGHASTEENTWRLGLDRLLLGYAMATDTPFGGALPKESADHAQAELVGALSEFAESLFALRRLLLQPRPPEDWFAMLERVRTKMFRETPADSAQHEELQRAFRNIADCAKSAGYSSDLPVACIQDRLEAILGYERSIAPFLTGGITFCQMVPMRSIPFRVIALIGMNYEVFPRKDRAPAFDLLAESPRRGDRTVRDEDRGVFLEAILSARDRLLVTHVGQGLQDNAPIPPSVVVSELLDSLRPALTTEDAEALIVRHPLQPFSPRYFRSANGRRLFSYDETSAGGASQLVRDSRPAPIFVDRALPPDDADGFPFEVTIDELETFFRNPSRAYVRRLGFQLGQDDRTVDDRQPLTVDFLEKWKLGTELLEQQLKTEGWDESPYQRAHLSGRLPPGQLGTYAFRQIEPLVQGLVKRAAPLLEGGAVAPVQVALAVEGFRIVGTLSDVQRGGPAYAQYARAGDTRDLVIWIRHLIWNVVTSSPEARESAFVARTTNGVGTFRFSPVSDPETALLSLLTLFRAGLRRPLPFFRHASRAYADRWVETEDDALSSRAARAKFGSFERVTSTDAAPRTDSDDPYVRRLFQSGDPLAREPHDPEPSGWLPFREAARTVYAPMLSHLSADEP